MNNSLVTVFGGSGFLGRHVVRVLAKEGYRVRVAVRRPNNAFFLRPMGSVGQIQLVKCDAREKEQVEAALVGADAAVNLVGILYPAGGQNYEAAHVRVPAIIGAAAKAAGMSTLLHVSTPGIDVNSESAYSRTKAEGEVALRREFPSATILCPSLVFGAEDNFYNKFAALARFTVALPLIGGGKTKFQPVFAGDVAQAVARCLGNPQTRGKTYELGGPNVYSFKEMLQIILRETGRKRLLIPIPFFLASIMGFFLQFLPGKLLTPDQVTFLKTDNVVASDALTLVDLGIVPTSLEAELPSYLWRFRPKGQFQELATIRTPSPP